MLMDTDNFCKNLLLKESKDVSYRYSKFFYHYSFIGFVKPTLL